MNLLQEAKELLESCDREEEKARELRKELRGIVNRVNAVTKRVQSICKEQSI
jgi:hypothetical protein